ncbi:WH2 motif family protein [Brugia malayi]|nr:WH2 motif family protein [Brugia malayi]VIO93351.1 WH2 motif family protein [Brugia malayi]
MFIERHPIIKEFGYAFMDAINERYERNSSIKSCLK